MDVYQRAQKAAERRLMAAEGSMDLEGGDEEPEGADELAGPYCGCHTCVVREVLDSVRPLFGELAAVERAVRETPSVAADASSHGSELA